MDVNSKIKCDGCNKNLVPMRFSETGKRKYFESRRKNQRNPKSPVQYPRCFTCNPVNRQEMKCGICGIVKDLNKFSRAARSKGDDRLCIECQQEKDDREPDHEDEVQEVEIIEEMKNSLHLGYGSHLSAIASATQRSRTENRSNRYETDTNPDEDSWYRGNDAISLPDTQSSVTSSSIGPTRRTTGTGWDQYSGDGRSIGTTTHASKGANAGFVKQNAVGLSAHEKAALQLQRENRRREQEAEQLSRDDSDDSDDGDEDPY